MKNLNFILISFLTVYFLQSYSQPLSSNEFNLSCQSNTICSLYANTQQGKKIITQGNYDSLKGYNYQSPQWFATKKIADITIGCGTSCSYSCFINFITGEVSPKYYLVYAINENKEVIVYPKSDKKDMTLLIGKIFKSQQKSTLQITRAFSSDVFLDISNINFDYDGNLNITYFYGKNYQQKTGHLLIDYNKFNQPGCWNITEQNQYISC